MLTHDILIESKTSRNSMLAERNDEHATDTLNKAKAIFMAVWQGTGYATTEQVAEYYVVSVETIKKIQQRNKEEFSGEVKKLTSKQVKEVRDIMSLPSNTSQALLWTPRAMLRVGLMLTESEVARNVRDVVLNVVESVKPTRKKTGSLVAPCF